MQNTTLICAVCGDDDMSGEIIRPREHWSDMAPEDRKLAVLRFLAEYGLALPPAVIYRNIRYHHNATFKRRVTDNYLSELVEEGLARRIEPEPLEDRQLVDASEDTRKAYYIVTEEGRDYLDEHF